MGKKLIKIGPSGWRVVFLKNLTADSYEAILQAMADVFGSQKVLIGFDNRFLSRAMASHAQKILKSRSWETHLVSDFFSTPGVARLVRHQKADWGLMVTASHNPYYYNGLKILDSKGCLVDEVMLKKIQNRANQIVSGIDSSFDPAYKSVPDDGWRDWSHHYLRSMLDLIDIKAIQKSQMTIAWDGFGGTTSQLFPALFQKLKLKNIGFPLSVDPTFGGRELEPSPHSTTTLQLLVRQQKCDLGLATDLDGDRFSVINSQGRYVPNNTMASLLLWYLLFCRKEKGNIFQTVSCSARNQTMCDEAGVVLEEVPVGFQVMGRRMKEVGGLLGMEETGGVAYGPHLQFKDGLMAHLLVMEMMATQKADLTKLIKKLSVYGQFYYRRWDKPIPDKKTFHAWQSSNFWEKKVSLKVKTLLVLDGQKMIFEDGSWLLLRPSKTEPFFRIYAEGRSKIFIKKLEQVIV